MSDGGRPSAPHLWHSDGEYKAEGALQQFAAWFFSSPKDPIAPGKVLAWWEARRLPFNIIIGAYGILCLFVFFEAISSLPPEEDVVEPLALIAAPIFVNLLYTLAWIVEITYRSIEPDVSPRFGPRLLKVGLGLGLFFSTLPAAFWTGYQLLQWVGVTH